MKKIARHEFDDDRDFNLSIEQNDEVAENRRLTWKLLLILTVIAMSGTAIVSFVALRMWSNSQPQVIPPGAIVDKYGKYESIDRRVHLRIGHSNVPRESAWNVSLDSPVGKEDSHVKFDSTKKWFSTIDASGRAWLFASSESVDGKGVFVWGVDSVHHVKIVGVHGGWERVPESFLEKLPEKHRKDYETWAKNQGLLPEE